MQIALLGLVRKLATEVYLLIESNTVCDGDKSCRNTNDSRGCWDPGAAQTRVSSRKAVLWRRNRYFHCVPRNIISMLQASCVQFLLMHAVSPPPTSASWTMKPDSYNIQYKRETVHGQNVILQLRCSYLIQLGWWWLGKIFCYIVPSRVEWHAVYG